MCLSKTSSRSWSRKKIITGPEIHVPVAGIDSDLNKEEAEVAKEEEQSIQAKSQQQQSKPNDISSFPLNKSHQETSLWQQAQLQGKSLERYVLLSCLLRLIYYNV